MIEITKSDTDRRYFAKKVILKISQISQKIPVLESLFNKVSGLQAPTLLKRDPNTSVFL